MRLTPSLFDPVAEPSKSRPVPSAETVAWRAWLANHASEELRLWNATLSARAVRGGYHQALFAVTAESFVKAATEHDGCTAARLRSLFIGASPILEDAEELWFATWAPTEQGTSQVWASHQDERDLWPVTHSLADFAVQQFREDPYFRPGGDQALELPAHLQNWVPDPGPSALPKGLNLSTMLRRTHWLVALFFPEGDWYGIGDGLIAAPAYSTFEAEQPLIAQWPHLQAYWLLHHLVFDNREALQALLPAVELCYLPTREIAELAHAALAKQPLDSKVWNEVAVRSVRATALEKYPSLFAPETLTRLKASGAASEQARADVKRLTDALDAAGAPGIELWKAFGEYSGNPDAEKALIQRTIKDPALQLTAILQSKRGNAPALGPLLVTLARQVDDRWLPLARAAMRASAGLAEDHAHSHLAALTVLGAVSKPWAASQAEVLGECGRLRRLALAAAATTLPGDPDATAFLRHEAARFIQQLSSSTTDTAELALRAMLVRQDDATIEALELALRGKVHATSCLVLLSWLAAEHPTVARFAPLYEAALTARLGRVADGQPVALAVALARCDAARASTFLAAQPTETLLDEVTVLAGHLTATLNDEPVRARAFHVLRTLDPTKEQPCGAGLALLRVLHQANVSGVDQLLTLWANAKRSKHAGEDLRRWFERTVTNSA